MNSKYGSRLHAHSWKIWVRNSIALATFLSVLIGGTPTYAQVETPTNTPTPTNTTTPTSTPTLGNTIIIDHNSIALFEYIPDSYIAAAASIPMLFRHASVGGNISYGLDCLMDKVQPRPPGCEGNFDPKYNRDN